MQGILEEFEALTPGWEQLSWEWAALGRERNAAREERRAVVPVTRREQLRAKDARYEALKRKRDARQLRVKAPRCSHITSGSGGRQRWALGVVSVRRCPYKAGADGLCFRHTRRAA